VRYDLLPTCPLSQDAALSSTKNRPPFHRAFKRRIRKFVLQRKEEIPLPPDSYIRLVCGDVPDVVGKFVWAGHVLVDMLEDEGLMSADARLLDVGCGCGRVARYLLDKPLGSYTGFDRHPGMIDWCREEIARRDPRFDFRCFSIKSAYTDLDREKGEIDAADFEFPFPDAAFDSALLASVFTHMPMVESVHYLEQLGSVLRPNGKVLLSVFYSRGEPYSEGLDFYYDPEAFLASVKRVGLKFRFREEVLGHHWYVLTR